MNLPGLDVHLLSKYDLLGSNIQALWTPDRKPCLDVLSYSGTLRARTIRFLGNQAARHLPDRQLALARTSRVFFFETVNFMNSLNHWSLCPGRMTALGGWEKDISPLQGDHLQVSIHPKFIYHQSLSSQLLLEQITNA